jgi:asparagine synthase (glutamine-hydrolysing)
MKIILSDNKAFNWYSQDGVTVKGYLFDHYGRYIQGQQLPAFFADIKSADVFRERLCKTNGLFSVVVQTGSDLYAAVDRSRTFPLFYKYSTGDLWLSDLPQELPATSLNEERFFEFLACGYVTGEQTLLKDIHQIQAGAFIGYQQGRLKEQKYYYRNSVKTTTNMAEAQYNEELIAILEKIGSNLVTSLQGRQAVIPLSGGYDSRLIAVLLKEQNYEPVLCFTFGSQVNNEMKTAKIIAGQFDYPWHFILNDKTIINDFLSTQEFKSYYRYASGFASMFFMEQYFALKYLTQSRLIDKDAVIIPGHSGDSIAGSHLRGYLTAYASKQKIVDEIFKRNFYLLKLPRAECLKIKNTISAFVGTNQNMAYSIYEDWILKERHAKFIVNSARVYPFFGYEFRMPLWDQQFVTFFKALPLAYKNYKYLYNHVLQDYFFKKYKLVFIDDVQKGRVGYKVQRFKTAIRTYLPRVLRQYYLDKNDTSGYKQITGVMSEEMDRAGYHYEPPDRNYNSVLTQWYLFKLLQERH